MKITDKMRLDWLSAWNKTRASKFRIGNYPWRKTVRQAIDAAIRAERRKAK